tara:strand:+ start:1840 stop:2463 length:624 start_codon:yes stop_codon:yes gene_type:complete
VNLTAVSFSYADSSMQARGIKLLDHILKFNSILDIKDIPVCNSNKSDGDVPQSVIDFDNALKESDALVFCISEATAHYCAGFKTAMDWLVVKSNFNSKLGADYSITNKPIYVFTFTPTYKDGGHRHFDMIKHLLEEKLGADVRNCFVMRDGWREVIPNNFDYVQDQAECIQKDLKKYSFKPTVEAKSTYDINKWLELYESWDRQWTE